MAGGAKLKPPLQGFWINYFKVKTNRKIYKLLFIAIVEVKLMGRFGDYILDFGVYAVRTSPIGGTIGTIVITSFLNVDNSRFVDGYHITETARQRTVSKATGLCSVTRWIDEGKDGTLNEKTSSFGTPSRIPVSRELPLTEADQIVYNGLLAKL